MGKRKWQVLVLAAVLGVSLISCGGSTTLRERMDATEGNRQKVVTALEAYFEEEGEYPMEIDQPPFIGDYIDKIPPERFKGKNDVVRTYSGQGGWMYDYENGEFFVNCNAE